MHESPETLAVTILMITLPEKKHKHAPIADGIHFFLSNAGSLIIDSWMLSPSCTDYSNSFFNLNT